jgi:NADP-dependent 3-hydroxy acid dehydrogenase YdfG
MTRFAGRAALVSGAAGGVGAATAHLTSSEAAFTTGTVHVMDGGALA